MRELLRMAEEAARTAAAIQLAARPREVREKGAANLVTEVDLACEDAIRRVLAPSGVPVLAEEGGGAWEARTRWIVDPLDGTTNFVHGFPAWAVSIALEVDGKLELGLVHDTTRDETCVALRGAGALVNGQPIRVSEVATLGGSLVSTGFPYDKRERVDHYLRFVRRFLVEVHCLRRAGSASLDLCWIARGFLDGYWEFDLKPWDVAAGALIVAEAGGRVSNVDGSPLTLDGGNILASNGRIHGDMMARLADWRTPG